MADEEAGYGQQNEVTTASSAANDKIYEPKHKKKVIRVLTVLAYVLFVSLAAIMLSAYYLILWKPIRPQGEPSTLPRRGGAGEALIGPRTSHFEGETVVLNRDRVQQELPFNLTRRETVVLNLDREELPFNLTHRDTVILNLDREELPFNLTPRDTVVHNLVTEELPSNITHKDTVIDKLDRQELPSNLSPRDTVVHNLVTEELPSNLTHKDTVIDKLDREELPSNLTPRETIIPDGLPKEHLSSAPPAESLVPLQERSSRIMDRLEGDENHFEAFPKRENYLADRD